MANENEIEITLSLINNIQKELSVAREQLNQFTSGVSNNHDKMSQRIIANNGKSIASIKQLAGAFGLYLGAVQFAQFTKKVFQLGLEVEKVSKIFNNLSFSKGFAGQEILDQMSKGFEGTVTNIEAQKLAIKALNTDLRLSADDFGRLSSAAKIFSEVSGRNVEDVFNAMITSIGRLNPRLLSQVQIYMSSKEAADLFSSGMSKAEKQMAMLQAIMDKSKSLQLKVGNLDGKEDEVRRLSVAFNKLQESLSKIATSAPIMRLINALTHGFENVAEGMSNWDKTFKPTTTKDAQFQAKLDVGHLAQSVLSEEQQKSHKGLQKYIELYNEWAAKNPFKDAANFASLLSEKIRTGKSGAELLLDKLRDLSDVNKNSVKTLKDEEGQLKRNKLISEQQQNAKDEEARLKANKSFIDKIEKKYYDVLSVNKKLQLSEELALKERKSIEDSNIPLSEKARLIDVINQGLREQQKEIRGVKSAEDELAKQVEKAQIKNPRRVLSEARKSLLLGDFTTEQKSIRQDRLWDQIPKNAEMLQTAARSQLGLAGMTPRLPNQIQQQDQGRTAQGESEVNSTIKNQSKAVKDLTSVLNREAKSQSSVLNQTKENMTKLVETDELIYQALFELKGRIEEVAAQVASIGANQNG